MVNNATRYKLNNAHIGLCASRGRSQWTVFSFSQQIDPVVSIHIYSSLICMGAIFQEHGSWSQNVVWRKKKRKKNQYKYICKRPQPYWSTYVKHFLKQRCVCVCVRVSSCVCCKVGGKKPHMNHSCENVVSIVRNWFTDSPTYFQLRAFLN